MYFGKVRPWVLRRAVPPQKPVDGIGMCVIVFETRELAEQVMAYPLPPLPGVTPRTVEIREVFTSV
jgi:hypothetical protein